MKFTRKADREKSFSVTFLLNFKKLQDRVKGIGAEIHLTVEQGKVVDAEIIDSKRI